MAIGKKPEEVRTLQDAGDIYKKKPKSKTFDGNKYKMIGWQSFITV